MKLTSNTILLLLSATSSFALPSKASQDASLQKRAGSDSFINPSSNLGSSDWGDPNPQNPNAQRGPTGNGLSNPGSRLDTDSSDLSANRASTPTTGSNAPSHVLPEDPSSVLETQLALFMHVKPGTQIDPEEDYYYSSPNGLVEMTNAQRAAYQEKYFPAGASSAGGRHH